LKETINFLVVRVEYLESKLEVAPALDQSSIEKRDYTIPITVIMAIVHLCFVVVMGLLIPKSDRIATHIMITKMALTCFVVMI